MQRKQICKMNKFNNLENKRFGRLLVVEKTNERSSESIVWLCRCDCGNIKKIRSSNLTHGETFSCGCLRKELFKNRITKHNMCSTPTYNTWRGMIERCKNPKNKRYKDYGDRNIEICKEWEVFENFYKDMGAKPSGKSLDRIDNNKGYEPSNYKWSTPTEQQNNTRRNSYITYKGIAKTVAGWAVERIIEKSIGIYRLKKESKLQKANQKNERNKI